MRINSLAMAVAIGLLLAGCGGGGGGGGGGGSSPATGTPTTGEPATSAPVVGGVATYAGSRSDYSIVRTSSGFTVTEKRNNSVTTVTGATSIRFSDMAINLGIGDKAVVFGAERLKSLIELYTAFMNRVPEANSLSAWIDQAQAGQSMAQIADRLHAEAILVPAASGLSAAMTHSEFVTAVYKNVFGRYGDTAPSPAEVASWASRIDKGGDLTRGGLVITMLAATRAAPGEPGNAAVIQLLDNKADVGDYVAVRNGVTYNAAEESVVRTKAIAAAVTTTDKSAAMAQLGFADTAFNLKLPGK